MTRRLVRLFVLLGVAAAVYLGLSLFDHAARADTGLTDQVGASEPVSSAKAMAARIKKPELKSITPRARTQTTRVQPPKKTHSARREVGAVSVKHAPKIRPAETVHRAKASAPEVHPAETVRHVRATVLKVRSAETVQRVRAAVLKVRPADAVRQVKALVPEIRNTETVRTSVSTVRQLTVRVTHGAAPAMVKPAWETVVGRTSSMVPPALTRTTAVPVASRPQQPGGPPTPAIVVGGSTLSGLVFGSLGRPVSSASAPALSGVVEAPALPRKSPPPSDRGGSTGQVRDSGGVHVPMMGTVLSSWRPEGAAVGRPLAVDLFARGRTVRFAGPPS